MAKALRLTLALAATLMASSAMAATVNLSVANNYFVGTPALSAIVPQAPDALAPVLTNTIGTINYVTPPPGSVTGTYRSPWQFTKSAGGTEYEPIGVFTSVQSDSQGDIVFTFGNRTALSLAWGSPDSYNELKFFNAGIEVASLLGSDILSPSVGVNFVTLSLLSGVFDTVRFFSHGQNAFEFANIRSLGRNGLPPEVPLPAGLVLLLTGLLGLGFLSRSRTKAA